MKITAKEVNQLRKATGAGMMDCKKALVEAEGDFDKAIEILRKKGQKVMAKRADREANEGVVYAEVTSSSDKGAIFALSCETDFVAKNNDFVEFGSGLMSYAIENLPSSKEEFEAGELNGQKISDSITDSVGKIGEKIEIRNYAVLSGEKVIAYIHPGAKLGVLIAFENIDGVDITSVGNDIAMQVAAMSPIALDEASVPAEIVDKEREIAVEQIKNDPKNANKPQEILEKIAEGKVNKFFKESTLLNQAFIKDSNMSVAKYLESLSKELKVTNFVRVQVGA